MIGCVSPITSDFTDNTTYINQGDSAKIYWNFHNASGVQIEGRYRIFDTEDSVYVHPAVSTSYRVTAFAPDKEDLTINWNVIVEDPFYKQRATNDISGGAISKINIIGSAFENNKYKFNFLASNQVNSFIIDEPFNKEDIEVNIPARPSAKVRIDSCGIFKLPDSVSNGICFCIDNSSANIYTKEIFNSITTASEYFHPNDTFYLSIFNHDLQNITELKKNKDGVFDNFNVLEPSGFTAINVSVGITINYLKQNLCKKDVNTMVIITSSSDNSSILYDENELLEHAVKNGIKIYVLAIGQSIPTYNLSKLADGTGGKLFLIDEDNLDDITHYINKVVFGLRNHYFVDVNFYKSDYATNVDFKLNIINSNKTLSDNVNILLKKEKLYSDFQAVASFENNELLINPLYDNLINRLTQTLINNPRLTIELIGNSNITEGREADCKRIALQRAQLLRKRLIKEGVNQEQIRITNNGSESPLYMFPVFAWQHNYNNRLEIRWMLVEDYPYEIVSDKLIARSEEIAMQEIESLENKGYKAYYQRIIKNERPAYRIIIWGYKTEKEASVALKEINNKLKLQATIRQLNFIDK